MSRIESLWTASKNAERVRHQHRKETLVLIGIILLMWQWARRRHPKKSRDWAKKRYFPNSAKRAWDFAFPTGKLTPDDKPIWRRLVYAGNTKFRRHVKIRQTANPFDPNWKAHFKERAILKKFGFPRQKAGFKPS